MSHTAGPWVQNEAEQFYLPHEPIRIGPCDEGQFRSVCEIDHLYFDGEEAEANARLIAAAPDLLEALKYVMSAHGEQLHDAFDMAQKAIAKAEGSVMGREQ